MEEIRKDVKDYEGFYQVSNLRKSKIIIKIQTEQRKRTNYSRKNIKTK